MAKKITQADKVRRYNVNHPEASIADIAKALGIRYQAVYAVLKPNGKATKPTKQKWKMVHMSTSTAPVADKVFEQTKGRKRPKFSIDSLPKVGDVVGGMTLTREEAVDGGGFVYRWVRTEPVKPIMVDMTQHADGTITEKVTEVTKGYWANHIQEDTPTDNVNHPAHYKVGGIETIDFIEAKGFGYNIGNVVKYLSRADNKGNREEDLLKARWYLNREIAKFTKE
jgi:predicted DNA-binding protein YlxM (UPF0122 family)